MSHTRCRQASLECQLPTNGSDQTTGEPPNVEAKTN